MYWLSITATTNYHKLNGFRQYKFIIFQFYRLEVGPGSHWATVEMPAGLYDFQAFEDLFISLLSERPAASGQRPAATFLGLRAPPSNFEVSNVAVLWNLLPLPYLFDPPLLPPIPLLRTLGITPGPPG